MLNKNILALDVGEKRIGLATADTKIKIAIPFGWLENDEQLMSRLAEIILRHKIRVVVIGYPRNQSGEPTQQTAYVQAFAERLAELDIDIDIVFQDESLTSVEAERRLGGAVRQKGDIDAEAASIILQDYLEETYAR